MSIVQVNAPRYRAARKQRKSRILSELQSFLHYHRKYLALLLRSAGRIVFTPDGARVVADPTCSRVSRRGRKKCYREELVPYLESIWKLASTVSSVHLVAFIRANRDFLFRHQDLVSMPAHLKRQLLSISHATIDRLLAPRRKRVLYYRPGHRNPHAAWLKKAIPVQSYAQKPAAAFGCLELDTVFHAGTTSRGQFALTLNVTEIETGWTELAALPNRAQVWVERSLRRIIRRLPFTPRALHTDNGSEFINRGLVLLSRELKLRYTRSRPLHKNDAPYVESKNASLVRAYVGRARYDSAAEIRILKRLMPRIALKHNLFMPTMKRDRTLESGAHRHFKAETPYHRLLKSGQLSAAQKTALRALRRQTDYFKLAAEIDRLGLDLDQVNRAKYSQTS
jgi:hypothetical protein